MSSVCVVSMCSAESLREFISGRLTAAAGEIFTMFEQTIAQYEDEIDRLRRHTHVLQQHHVSLESLDGEEPGPVQKEPEQLLQDQETGPVLVVKTKPEPNTDQDHKLENQEPEQEFRLKLINQNKNFTSPETFVRNVLTHENVEEFSLHLEEESHSSLQRKRTLRREVPKQERPEPGPVGSTGSTLLEIYHPRNQDSETRSFRREAPPEFCGEPFYKPSSLKPHLESHTEEKPLGWDTHAQSSSQFRDWSAHHSVDSDGKPHCCAKCGERCSEREKQTHACERPYVCEKCGKRFSVDSKLNIHRRSHTGEKPFSCEICGKCLANPDTLKLHMRTHTGEKPYSCELCEKRFPARRDLTRHMTTHTGERPYSCEICRKGFSRQQALNVHMRVHTGEKPYSCHICGKSFTQNINLKTHTKTHSVDKF